MIFNEDNSWENARISGRVCPGLSHSNRTQPGRLTEMAMRLLELTDFLSALRFGFVAPITREALTDRYCAAVPLPSQAPSDERHGTAGGRTYFPAR
jgi:hypothetical protein